MKITSLINFGFIPQKPLIKQTNCFNNFDKCTEDRRDYFSILNKNYVYFGKRIVLEDYKEEIAKLRKEGKTIRQIAEIIGCSSSAAGYAIKRWNLGKRGDESKPSEDTVIGLYQEGKSIEEIANLTNCSKRYIDIRLHELGILPVQSPGVKNRDKIIDLYKSGMSQCQIAKIIGCSQNAISYNLIKAGCGSGNKKRIIGLIDSKREYIINQYYQGESMKKIADAVGCTMSGIELALKRWNVEPRERITIANFKDEIIELYHSGLTQLEISRVYGCKQQTISTYLKKWGAIK